jgi:ADP-heptose:LPS heptosyltransferase
VVLKIKENLVSQPTSLKTENLQAWNALEKVAFVRVGALGDLVVGLAALWEMVNLFPKAFITLVGPQLWTEILEPEDWHFVREIAVVERRGTEATIYKRSEGKWKKGDTVPLLQVLRECDGIVNTNIDSYRYGFLAMRAGIGMRIGSAPALMSWLYTYASPFFGKDPVMHERDAPLLMLELAEASVAKYFKFTSKNRARLQDILRQSTLVNKWREQGLPYAKSPDLSRASEIAGAPPEKYVVVNPTSSRREKAWPAERFRELLLASQSALSERGLEVIVVGAPTETDWLREVAGDEFRMVQPPSVRDLQDVLSASRGLLTNTSSVQFIAAATGTPTVTLMGRAKPEIWGPVGPRDAIIEGQPPQDLAHNIFEQEKEGYRSISVEDVLPKFLALIETPRVR